MTSSIKSIAAAALVAGFGLPAFADGHIGTSMTCEEYNQLSGANRDKVAMMAIAELADNAEPTDGTATATESSVGDSGSTESASGTGGTSATATSVAGAGNDMTEMEERIAVLNRTCSRNWDAMVKEAAAGQSGTR